MTTLSKKQVKALEMIKKIEDHFGSRWFVQQELPNITMHTIDALEKKGYIESKEVEDMPYYRLIFEGM